MPFTCLATTFYLFCRSSGVCSSLGALKFLVHPPRAPQRRHHIESPLIDRIQQDHPAHPARNPFLATIMVHPATHLETFDPINSRRQLESTGDHPHLETIGSIQAVSNFESQYSFFSKIPAFFTEVKAQQRADHSALRKPA
ncbi:uncharacterized protein LACBIDRAFT_324319 [Laccaria bicolor S238N-H82]|uniref:Predicted protein n=1 Tax=Laccaria bicolor (strain S238N-H82 / ATCC MYA-4686) TaxID=486041 RepID=B0D1F7_LACBS|nr:uncharacterized protein LACBIDRAFT_324319 [Laccaria bicolor S238N-H82]EDR11992.1 predicted protein [Laccaria bicolor S238N-H82]|eukprot:XP_001877889.1 predicted protein [Laccaria bicolor S238N-H82]